MNSIHLDPLSRPGSLARLLWAFEMRLEVDEMGGKREADVWAYNDSENMRPLPFAGRFVVRSEKIKEVLVREAGEARERLRRWDGETEWTVKGAAEGGLMV
ncbi:hypothetical protein BDZ85DRAFT_279020 [Elsinoe ampelina]|uniref:Uncharacterized protein n=1 Tax=Elsinoe ampelina TaxID=302913 RepID=A0A6A6GNC4_9PEZI|nr:hypothetical protein BDZ85DRAFT_279020 [Elsinoe ampelina]